ncbi:MAG: D-aminoacylase [Candidatus Moraniibacteriota bacterium]|nr:MAG: D-aminoacylase [Candidatus Moranbacteria bacterium]
MYDILLRGGLVYDGTGAKPVRADVAIKDGFIHEMGEISKNQATRESIDVEGKVVSPGFIDVNNHSDTHWRMFFDPKLESLLSQGITTIIGGSCGSSLAPLLNEKAIDSIRKWIEVRSVHANWGHLCEFFSYLALRGIPLNFATLVGHNTLRRALVGDENRACTEEELAQAVRAVQTSLQEGALGLSFGLAYTHAKAADEREIQSLMKAVSAKGIITVHLRNEGPFIQESLGEMLEYAKNTQSRLHISHLKVMGKRNWQSFDGALSLLDTASQEGVDVSFDVFPYDFSGSVLYTLLPDWVCEGGRMPMLERLRDFPTKRQIVSEMKQSSFEFEKMHILSATFLNQSLTKKNISEIAKSRGIESEEAFIEILLASEGRALARMNVLSEENMEKAMKHPLSMICSDGSGYSLKHKIIGEEIHPRNFGAFPRFLGHYVREKKLLSLEEALYKITGFPAKRFGISQRGVLKEGNYADIVVFDPDKIRDEATVQNPYQYASGIEYVVVNGEFAWRDSQCVAKNSGLIVKRK